jgi:hypothetical protein
VVYLGAVCDSVTRSRRSSIMPVILIVGWVFWMGIVLSGVK